MQLARSYALTLLVEMPVSPARDLEQYKKPPQSVVLAVSRVALPYSLKQLSGWLARDDRALGAALPSQCDLRLQMAALAQRALRANWLRAGECVAAIFRLDCFADRCASRQVQHEPILCKQ